MKEKRRKKNSIDIEILKEGSVDKVFNYRIEANITDKLSGTTKPFIIKFNFDTHGDIDFLAINPLYTVSEGFVPGVLQLMDTGKQSVPIHFIKRLG